MGEIALVPVPRCLARIGSRYGESLMLELRNRPETTLDRYTRMPKGCTLRSGRRVRLPDIASRTLADKPILQAKLS
jgi:hypothetical protein